GCILTCSLCAKVSTNIRIAANCDRSNTDRSGADPCCLLPRKLSAPDSKKLGGARGICCPMHEAEPHLFRSVRRKRLRHPARGQVGCDNMSAIEKKSTSSGSRKCAALFLAELRCRIASCWTLHHRSKLATPNVPM